MPKSSSRLHEVPPREQVGAVTGARYEYQYKQAAGVCLELLNHDGPDCVFCEWHDDFVSEKKASVSLYWFHQVKTRTASQGLWTISEVFGLPRRGAAKTNSIAYHLFEHFLKFGQSCDRVLLVTNSNPDRELATFLGSINGCTRPGSLPAEQRVVFKSILASYKLTAAFKSLTEMDLYRFLKNFEVISEAGRFNHSDRDYRSLLWEKIFELSEINLSVQEALRIGDELLALVRKKSHKVLNSPPSDAELRELKGVRIEEVLSLLSLSSSAYAELQSSGPGALKTLSRLQRLCSNSGIEEAEIAEICKLKVEWDAWHLRERHRMNKLDILALRQDCFDLLQQHSKKRINFSALADAAATIANKYNPKLSAGVVLSRELVIGLVFALAAEAA